MKYDPKKEGLELNHPSFANQPRPQQQQALNRSTTHRSQNLSPIPEAQRQPRSATRARYTNPSMIEDELFTQNQAILYVLMNFAVATILLVAVNANIKSVACAPIMKQWLISLALILSANSLLQVFGIDIRRKPLI